MITNDDGLHGKDRGVWTNRNYNNYLGACGLENRNFPRLTRGLVFRDIDIISHARSFNLRFLRFLYSMPFNVYWYLLPGVVKQCLITMRTECLSVMTGSAIVTGLGYFSAMFFLFFNFSTNRSAFTILRGQTRLVRLDVMAKACRVSFPRNSEQLIIGKFNGRPAGIFREVGLKVHVL